MDSNWLSALEALKQSGALPEGEENVTVHTGEAANAAVNNSDAGHLHVLIEKKGRHGKTATIIEGFTCDDERLQEIARMLKQRIGTGGSARGGEILLQGEWREKVRELLKSEGFRVK